MNVNTAVYNINAFSIHLLSSVSFLKSKNFAAIRF